MPKTTYNSETLYEALEEAQPEGVHFDVAAHNGYMNVRFAGVHDAVTRFKWNYDEVYLAQRWSPVLARWVDVTVDSAVAWLTHHSTGGGVGSLPVTPSVLPSSPQYSPVRACPRCNGRGRIPQYRHVEGGICFLCYGQG